MRLFKLKSCDYSNRFLKSINSRCPCICQSKIFTNLPNYKMVKKKFYVVIRLQSFRKYSNEMLSTKKSKKGFTCLDSQNPKRNNVTR